MGIILLIIFLILFYKMQFVSDNEGYLSKYQTTCINGFFVLLILIFHFEDYVNLGSILDKPFMLFDRFRGQLIVVTFLFFSGYGIMESIKKRGLDYIRTIPKKRFLKVYIHLFISILIFLAAQYGLGTTFSKSTIFLTFLGWDSVGNCNWYIFAILFAYIFTYSSFKIFKNDTFKSLLSITFLSFVYVFIMHTFKERWWYDTFLCYVVGMYYSYYKEDIERLLRDKGMYILVLFIFINLFLLYFTLKKYTTINLLLMISFGILITLLSKKIKIGNSILYWFGTHTFSMYMLQRIPMLIFQRVDFIANNTLVYFGFVFVASCIMSWVFDKVLNKFDSIVFKEAH